MADSKSHQRALALIEFAREHDSATTYRRVQVMRPGAALASDLAGIAAAAVAELAAARSTSFGEALSTIGAGSTSRPLA
jgi:hypothetical protein